MLSSTVSRRPWRLLRVLALLALVGGLLMAAAPVAAEGHEEDPSDPPAVEITLTPTGEFEEGSSWSDDWGFHFRDDVEYDDVSGAVTGTAVTLVSGDWAGPCHAEEEFCEGTFWIHADLTITDEAGTWEGQVDIAFSSDGDALGTGLLLGRGGNAGWLFVVEEVIFVDDEAGSVTLVGVMVQVATPMGGLSVHVDACIATDGGVGGGYIVHGLASSSGSVDGYFVGPNLTDLPGYSVLLSLWSTDESDPAIYAVVTQEMISGEGYGEIALYGETAEGEVLFYGYGWANSTWVPSATCSSGWSLQIHATVSATH
jgi:hypothetical protein